jgi:protein ImuA
LATPHIIPDAMQHVSKNGARAAFLTAVLKRRIARIEGRMEILEATASGTSHWRFGIAEVDTHLPRGLERAGLHEIAPSTHADMGATLSFALALLKTLPTDNSPMSPRPNPPPEGKEIRWKPKPILWCQSAEARREFGRPFGPGLVHHGLAQEQLLFLTARREADVLWAIEEAVRSRAPAAILGEVKQASFLASRRLALATAEAGLPVLLIASKPAGTSAAHTRWRIAARPGPADAWDSAAPGALAWQAALRRVRGGHPSEFDLEWNDETHHFRLAAALADRADAASGKARRAS